MKFLKHNQRLLICYSIKELLGLFLSKDFIKIINPAINNFNNLEKVKKEVFELNKISANSKSY